MNCFPSACKMLGLEISLKKTVVMFQPAPGSAYVEPSIFVDDTKLKVVEKFVYLGSTLSQDGSLDNEIMLRIQNSSSSFGKLQTRLWYQHDIKLSTKLSIYKACIITTLLYASESWAIYKSQIKILERFHQRCLRRILNIKWTSFIPDTEVLESANIPSIEALIIKSQLGGVDI